MTEEKPAIECSVCHRTFKTQAALISHQKTHQYDDVELSAPTPPQPVEEILAQTGFYRQLPRNSSVSKIDISEDKPDMVTIKNVDVDSLRVGVSPTYPEVVKIKMHKLPHYGSLPDLTAATSGSAAIDLYAAIPDEQSIPINGWALIPTGIEMEIPAGYCAFVLPRSGLAANHGITLLNAPGLIDSDYRGEIKAIVVNNTTSKFRVQPGMRIAQLLVQRHLVPEVEYVDELGQTERGKGGFGSTGT